MYKTAANIIREYGPFPDVKHVHGVSYDGRNIWIAGGDKLLAVDADSGKPVRTLDVACHAGTAFDGTHLFQIAEKCIQKTDPDTGRVLATIPAPGDGADSGLVWAEGALWVGQYRERKIHQIDPYTGKILRTIESNRFVTRRHLGRRRTLARHLERRRKRNTAHRSTKRRSAGAVADARRRDGVGIGVGRWRAVFLRRWQQRQSQSREAAGAGAELGNHRRLWTLNHCHND